MDPSLKHVQYTHPSSLSGGFGQPTGDGLGGLLMDNEDTIDKRENGLQLWQSKYQFQEDMLPMFVGEAFGRKVRSICLGYALYLCHPDFVNW